MPALRALAVAALLALSPTTASAASQSEQRAKRIGAQAYVYGAALLYEQRVIVNFPVNTLINVTQLSTPAERLIPAPNVDTLYTVARLSLSAEPLIVHVPATHGRYYTFQLVDAYTNTFGYIGRRVTGTRAGDFALIGPGWRGQIPHGVKRIHVPTPTMWIIGRTLVRSPADVSNANAIQHGYALTPLSRFGGQANPALFLPKGMLKPAPVPTGLAYYDAMGSLMAANPPPKSERKLMRLFASVGIGPGRTPSSAHLDQATRKGLLEGLKLGRRQIARYARLLNARSRRAHNGWLLPPKGIGNYGHKYLLRAYVAIYALGANVPAEAIYPFAFVDSRLKLLTGRHRYVVHFAPGELPPVKAFWSLTMYDKDLFLVPNPLARYAFGDRTSGLKHNPDGSLDILIQHVAPKHHRANWLPAPAGTFVLALRLYQPKPNVLRGAWPLPTITRVG